MTRVKKTQAVHHWGNRNAQRRGRQQHQGLEISMVRAQARTLRMAVNRRKRRATNDYHQSQRSGRTSTRLVARHLTVQSKPLPVYYMLRFSSRSENIHATGKLPYPRSSDVKLYLYRSFVRLSSPARCQYQQVNGHSGPSIHLRLSSDHYPTSPPVIPTASACDLPVLRPTYRLFLLMNLGG